MEDTGLPRRGDVRARLAPRGPAHEIAARFAAPLERAITVSDSLEDITQRVSATLPAPVEIPPPRLALPAPIQARDLLWLALALLAIIGTGVGIRDPWPAD